MTTDIKGLQDQIDTLLAQKPSEELRRKYTPTDAERTADEAAEREATEQRRRQVEGIIRQMGKKP